MYLPRVWNHSGLWCPADSLPRVTSELGNTHYKPRVEYITTRLKQLEPSESLLLKALAFLQSLTRKSSSCLACLKNRHGKVLAEKILQSLWHLKNGIKRMGFRWSPYSIQAWEVETKIETKSRKYLTARAKAMCLSAEISFPECKSPGADSGCTHEVRRVLGQHLATSVELRPLVGHLSSDALGCDYLQQMSTGPNSTCSNSPLNSWGQLSLLPYKKFCYFSLLSQLLNINLVAAFQLVLKI